MASIKDFPQYLYNKHKAFRTDVPSLTKAYKFIDDLINFFFPIKAEKECILPQIELNLLQLQLDFKDLLKPMKKRLEQPVEELAEKYFHLLPECYEMLFKDATSFMNFDPAAKSMESVILYYPGFYAISVYRLAHELYKLKIPYVPRMLSEYAHSKTGIDLHPGAEIGENFFIDHGTGVVIGETTVIGDNVKIYQGVTLGAMYVEKKMANTKRHPTLEDNVIIYSGSTILGGNTIIGHDTIVGGNVWLTKSVAPYSIVYHESKTVIRDSKKNEQEPINFVI